MTTDEMIARLENVVAELDEKREKDGKDGQTLLMTAFMIEDAIRLLKKLEGL